jgi:hypothetical protein
MVREPLAWGLLALLLGGLTAAAARADRAADGGVVAPPRVQGRGGGASSRLCHLYFADADYRYLVSEQRLLPSGNTPEELALSIVDALIKGPENAHTRTLPVDSRVHALYIDTDGTAYLDMSEEVKTHFPGGCFSELLTLFSLVNSLTLNLEEIDRVKILIGGGEALTLAGHVDLRRPFKADLLLIR